MLSKVKKKLSQANPGFRMLCPSRWTGRVESLKSALDN